MIGGQLNVHPQRRCRGRRKTPLHGAEARRRSAGAVAVVALILSSSGSASSRVVPIFVDAAFSHRTPSGSSSPSSSTTRLSSPRSQPCVGTATTRNGRVRYTVIGTSHFRCNSAAEVRRLIEDVRPDGVVVELDPERVVRLTKEGMKSPDEEQPFGADFLAAIDTARSLDVPLFVGDEYTKETRARLVRTALSPETYGPGRLMTAFFPSPLRADASTGGDSDSGGGSSRPIDLPGTFAADPMKLVPPLATVSPALLLALAAMPDVRLDDAAGNVTTVLALVLSFLATCKVFNTFIADRDDVLASSAARAAGVVASLKRGETLRKQWTFTVNGDEGGKNCEGEERGAGFESGACATPLFTLKTQLDTGKVRNLNLFEPRWLKMIDGVRSRGSGALESQTFGCVTCTNKFYSAVEDANGREGRYADIIFKRRGAMAEITELTEGRRPTSGDRKVSVRIEGRGEFVVEEESVSVSEDGYLLASDIIRDEDARYAAVESDRGQARDGGEEINILLVVGLLHANGVIERLSSD